jgi:lysophospholipase L1-like esterase
MRAVQIIEWTVLLGALSTSSFGCVAEASAVKQNRTARVLIIGDSISIGYFEPTKHLLGGKAEVYHNAGNAQHTRRGLAQLDAWLGDTPWDVIHFNHGLHDLKYVDAQGNLVSPDKGTQLVPIDEYARNLEHIVRRLKKTHARLIFATTTPVPDGAAGRIKGDAERYNRAALAVMTRYHVQVNDLYAFALPRLEFIQRPHNVHFTDEGSRLLAQQVASSIVAALARR